MTEVRTSITACLNEALAEAGVRLDRFREIAQRLLAWGVVVRAEDRTEQMLYDDALRIESTLEDYFDLMGFRLLHDRTNQFLRLYGPGAEVDSLPPDTLEPMPALKTRLSADFVAAALALRLLFEEGLQAGELGEGGEVFISLEQLSSAMSSHLQRAFPLAVTQQMNLLAELKRHRLVSFKSGFSPADHDALLAIRPVIVSVVSFDAMALAQQGDALVEDSAAESPAQANAEEIPTTDKSHP